MTVTDIRQQIRDRMQKLGITQVELAERSGIARPSISRWLKGDNDAGVEWVQRLAHPLGLELAFRTRRIAKKK